MDLQEFVRLNPDAIRRDKDLMQLFVEFYKAAFSLTPSCAGCVFKKGFKRLRDYVNSDDKISNFDKTIKTNQMESKTFQLKNQFKLKILSYRKDNKTYRSYGYNMTEEFARELYKVANNDYFVIPPKIEEEIEVIDEVVIEELEIAEKDYHSKNYREEILPLYSELKEKTGLKAESNKKDDVIAFIKQYES